MRLGPPAGVGSRTGDDQGAACPALRELRERAVFAAQADPGLKDGGSLEANEKAEKVFPEQVTHHHGTSSPGPNLHALCPLQTPGKNPSNLRSSFGVDLGFPWDHMLPSHPPPTAIHSWGWGRDSQQQLEEMNESISL